MNNIIVIGLFLSIAVIAFIISVYAYNKVESVGFNKLLRSITGAGIKVKKTDKQIKDDKRNRYFLISFGVATICGMIMLWGTDNVISDSMLIGILAGFVVSTYIKIYESIYTSLKRKEVRTLFISVENLMLSGATFEMALRETSKLLIYIRPAVAESIAYFPDTSEVLEKLREQLNIPEADILVSLLYQLNKVGVGRFEGAIQKEVKILEEMQASADKIRIQNRANAIIIPRMMSLAVIILMLIGTLILKMEMSFDLIGL